MRIEVVYALPHIVHARTLRMAAGSTVADAVAVFLRDDRVALAHDGVGIFGRRCDAATPLRDGDRVELYRPLVADAKQVRRERARLGKR
nr:RnfH family protein [Chiayiivirga flava]